MPAWPFSESAQFGQYIYQILAYRPSARKWTSNIQKRYNTYLTIWFVLRTVAAEELWLFEATRHTNMAFFWLLSLYFLTSPCCAPGWDRSCSRAKEPPTIKQLRSKLAPNSCWRARWTNLTLPHPTLGYHLLQQPRFFQVQMVYIWCYINDFLGWQDNRQDEIPQQYSNAFAGPPPGCKTGRCVREGR